MKQAGSMPGAFGKLNYNIDTIGIQLKYNTRVHVVVSELYPYRIVLVFMLPQCYPNATTKLPLSLNKACKTLLQSSGNGIKKYLRRIL